MAHAASTSAAPAAAFREDVQAELVRYLYRQAPASVVILFVVGCILAYNVWDIASQRLIVGWLIALATACTIRFAQMGLFIRRNPPNQGIERWAVMSAAGSVFLGTLWGAASVLFLDPAHPISLITLTVIMMGVAAGAVVNLASFMPSFWAIVGPSMGALIAMLFWYGDSTSTTVALLATIAMAAYVIGARNVHRLLRDSLQLSFENLELRREAEKNVAD